MSPTLPRAWSRVLAWFRRPSARNVETAALAPVSPDPNLVDLRKFRATRATADADAGRVDLICPALLQSALQTGAWLRTRGGQRVRLNGEQVSEVSPDHDDPRPLTGAIELRGATGHPAWCDCAWFSNGAHTLHEHVWDLVSVETARCRQCGCTDLHACATPAGPCRWIYVNRRAGVGLCSGCAARDAA